MEYWAADSLCTHNLQGRKKKEGILEIMFTLIRAFMIFKQSYSVIHIIFFVCVCVPLPLLKRRFSPWVKFNWNVSKRIKDFWSTTRLPFQSKHYAQGELCYCSTIYTPVSDPGFNLILSLSHHWRVATMESTLERLNLQRGLGYFKTRSLQSSFTQFKWTLYFHFRSQYLIGLAFTLDICFSIQSDTIRLAIQCSLIWFQYIFYNYCSMPRTQQNIIKLYDIFIIVKK